MPIFLLQYYKVALIIAAVFALVLFGYHYNSLLTYKADYKALAAQVEANNVKIKASEAITIKYENELKILRIVNDRRLENAQGHINKDKQYSTCINNDAVFKLLRERNSPQ